MSPSIISTSLVVYSSGHRLAEAGDQFCFNFLPPSSFQNFGPSDDDDVDVDPIRNSRPDQRQVWKLKLRRTTLIALSEVPASKLVPTFNSAPIQ